jgi:hypothetical protein
MGSNTMLMDVHLLSPVVSQYNWNLYRVPVRKVGNQYTIYVDNFFTRVFDENSLPDVLKTKMAMILASPHQIVSDREVTSLMLLTTTEREDFKEIGWRVSDTFFCVILNNSDLCALRGGIVSKETA